MADSSSPHSNGVYSNGTSLSNGHGLEEEEEQQRGVTSLKHTEHKRKQPRVLDSHERDIISLIGQHLREKGFDRTLDSLMAESGCALEHPRAACFRTLVITGQWIEANKALEDLSALLTDQSNLQKMKLLLLEEKYLELLEEGETLSALHCLRHEIVPLAAHSPDKRIQDLTSYVMCKSQKELYQLSGWNGVQGGARQMLIDRLQAFLPASVMLPPRRLDLLMNQAVQLQVDRCPFHYVEKDLSTFSLLTDHICPRHQFPSETVHTIKEHADEVLFVSFSHDGTQLASGAKDGQVIIWKIQKGQPPVKQHTMRGQRSGIGSICWSPDDSLLAICGSDDSPEAFIYNAKTGEERCRIQHSQDDSYTSCAWHYQGQKLYIGGLRGQFYECSAEDGSVTGSWEGVRIHAMASHPSSDLVYAADSHMRIRQYNFTNKTSVTILKEDHPIMTFTLSQDGRYALLNVASQGVHKWDMVNRCLLQQYQGVTQGYYTIHSSFGMDELFIASGSEDNYVYVWNHRRETPVLILHGHTRTVNSVAWNPVYHTMIASASDDGTLRIWGTEEDMKAEKERQKVAQEEQQLRNQVTNGETEREEEEEEEEDEETMDPSVRHRQLSEADLRTLETLEPDSSSQGSSGAMSAVERLEAAMSLSTLSAGLLEGGAGYQFHEVEHQQHEQQAVGVLVIMSPDHIQHSISLEDSGARSLDSSMESESSRQLVEGDAASQPQLEEEDTRTSTGATAAATSAADGGSLSSSSPSRQQQQPQPQAGETSNGSSSQAQSSSSQQQQQRSQQSSTTGTSISTVV